MTSAVKNIVACLVVLAVAAVLALAVGHRGLETPLLMFMAVAFGLQVAAFVPSYAAKTEGYYDLTGSISYISVVVFALLWVGRFDVRSLLVAAMVGLWALRLGSFLFLRIRRAGSDSRFDEIKLDGWRFLMVWLLQGLWISVTLLPVFMVMLLPAEPLSWWAAAGVLIWQAGFLLEIVADEQKRQFRKDNDSGSFITSGVWAWSRHPNYCGEIVLWFGLSLIAVPLLHGWHWLALVSPLFVFVLLTKISGVNLLEAAAERRWGDNPAYRDYVRRTPVLWPRPPRY